MSKIKKKNTDYTGGIPFSVGDRYYDQDLSRDILSGIDYLSTAMRSIVGLSPALLRGGICTKGTNFDDMNITAGFGIVGHNVTTPDNFGSLPPTTQTEDILAIIVESIQQVDLDLTTGTLNGATTNYVKLRYKEDDGATRNRAKKSGSYVYEKEPSFEIIVDTVAPTIYDIQLCSFIGDGSSFLTIIQTPPYFIYDYTYPGTVNINFGNSLLTNIEVDVSGGNVSIPAIPVPNSVGQRINFIATGGNIADIASGNGLTAKAFKSSDGIISIVSISLTEWRYENDALGKAQTWQNVTGSRALGVQYTNTTGRPIFVSVLGSNLVTAGGVALDIFVDGIAVVVSGFAGAGLASGNAPIGVVAIVPAGSTYQSNAVSATFTSWFELR